MGIDKICVLQDGNTLHVNWEFMRKRSYIGGSKLNLKSGGRFLEISNNYLEVGSLGINFKKS